MRVKGHQWSDTRGYRLLLELAFALAVALVGVVPGARAALAGTPERVSYLRGPLAVTANDLQQWIYLYASAEPGLQREARAAGVRAGLSAGQVARVSAAVRSAWLRMMALDPAALGRLGYAPNPSGRRTVVDGLQAVLRQIAGPRYLTLLDATRRTYQRTSNPAWVQSHISVTRPLPPEKRRVGQSWVLAWATSFEMAERSASERYVALPDAYVKFANLGWTSVIPSIYRPYYLPQAGSGLPMPPYTVDIAAAGGDLAAPNVFVADTGPWSEDDNWWDPVYTGAPDDPAGGPVTLPPGCPVSSTLVSPNALRNAQVDGICPGPRNWRRTAYYLLYKHQALPFFQPSAYAPRGPYADSTNWPPVLPAYCAEAALASVNDDRAPCAANGYNNHASLWLRNGTYHSAVLNQASIDLSPAMDAALGWTYPSSGFVQVNVSRLP